MKRTTAGGPTLTTTRDREMEVPRAEASERASLLSTVYVISALAMSVPGYSCRLAFFAVGH